jgi:hypothetical protein
MVRANASSNCKLELSFGLSKPPGYPDCIGSSGLGTAKDELSCERCNVSRNVVSVPPTHCKIHLCVRADERSHEIILIKSVFSANYFKGRRVCNDAPQTSANDVARRASILSYMPAALNIPSERHSRHKGQREASRKTKSIASHRFLRFIRAAFHMVEREEAENAQVLPSDSASWLRGPRRQCTFAFSRAPRSDVEPEATCFRHSKYRRHWRVHGSVTRYPRWLDWRRGPCRP